MTDFFDTSYYKIGAPIISFVAGAFMTFLQRVTLSKKEKTDIEQKDYENTERLTKEQTQSYESFMKALKAYTSKDGDPTADDFFTLALEGEKYFASQRAAATAILSGRIEKTAINNTFLPKLRDTRNRTLPTYYEVLSNISKRLGFEFSGKLQRSNYESIYEVTDKYEEKPSAYLHGSV